MDLLWEELKNRRFQILKKEFVSEEKLEKLAVKVKDSDDEKIIKDIIDYAVNNETNKVFDWNIGSLLQHFDAQYVISLLKRIPLGKRGYLCNMIGIIWVLGEFQSHDSFVIDLLNDTIRYSQNNEAWWRAAFSLERIKGSNGVNLLKRNLKERGLKSLEYYLQNLDDKRSVIGVLLYANNQQVKDTIFNVLKQELYQERSETLLNVIWLLGRLHLFNKEIFKKVKEILDISENYEQIYYIFWALQQNPTLFALEIFEKYLNDRDPLIRRMVVRGIGEIGDIRSLEKLECLLQVEESPVVLSAITKALYQIKNPRTKWYQTLKKKYIVNENGLIGDDSDKWYADPGLYNIFSEAEDVENVCFDLVLRQMRQENRKLVNPVDLATGTGRIFRLLLQTDYEGTLYGVDLSSQMLHYLDKIIMRQKGYIFDIQLVNSSIQDFKLENKSSFIISCFGFPSKIFNPEICQQELKAVYDNLTDDGIFVTIGWDESFNDELNEMWYKYIPDDIVAEDFEEWRIKRSGMITSPRNCCLSWFKKKIVVPLQFSSTEAAVNVMGHLFGRDAAIDVLQNHQKEWKMSLGITYNTKQELSEIITIMEKKHEGN